MFDISRYRGMLQLICNENNYEVSLCRPPLSHHWCGTNGMDIGFRFIIKKSPREWRR